MYTPAGREVASRGDVNLELPWHPSVLSPQRINTGSMAGFSRVKHCDVDCVSPKADCSLYRRITGAGVVVSRSPFLVGPRERASVDEDPVLRVRLGVGDDQRGDRMANEPLP